MSTQWFRTVRLVVGSGGTGIEIGNTGSPARPCLRMVFEVVKTVEAVPNTATIRVYNLNSDHVAAIKNDYDDVILEAGYADSKSNIFAGNIQYVSHYRDGTDYITEITAGDGDRDYRNAYINETIAAGETDDQAVSRIVAKMTKTSKGVVQTTGAKRSRGKVLQGRASDHLSQIARNNMANWSIQDGKLQMVRTDSRLDKEAIVLDSTTGLLEAPERNDKGISAKCLLNPAIEINGAIKLDNLSIRVKQPKQKALKPSTQSTMPPAQPAREDPNGIYKVIKLTHSGDTRSNEWYTTVECLSLNQSIATSGEPTTAKGTPYAGYAAIAEGLGIQTPATTKANKLSDIAAGLGIK